MKKTKQWQMVRVEKNVHETLTQIADVSESTNGDVIREMIASIPENGIEINHKRVLMVKHADGRIEINPAAAE